MKQTKVSIIYTVDRIVKEFIVDVWESRKLRLYGENACPGPQPNSSGLVRMVSCGMVGMAGVVS